MLAQYDNTVTPATTFFAHQDHLGSTRLLTKVNQSVQECSDYYPFGELETSTCTPNPGTATTSHKFTGKERDTESGLDNFLARYMASNQGRFFGPDPENAGADLGDPQSWNGYAYARNNPLLFIDPDGRNYIVCIGDPRDQNTRSQMGRKGQTCYDMTDDEYTRWRRDNPNIKASPSGILEEIQPDGSMKKVGKATYYDEKKMEALLQAGHSAEAGINAAMWAVSPNFVVAGGAALVLRGATFVGSTIHGATKLADPSRLNWFETQAVLLNPTRILTNTAGMTAFIQNAGEKFNVVVMKGKETLTNYYHLTQRELEKMAQKWGWQ